jgi:hypothetical protein
MEVQKHRPKTHKRKARVWGVVECRFAPDEGDELGGMAEGLQSAWLAGAILVIRSLLNSVLLFPCCPSRGTPCPITLMLSTKYPVICINRNVLTSHQRQALHHLQMCDYRAAQLRECGVWMGYQVFIYGLFSAIGRKREVGGNIRRRNEVG